MESGSFASARIALGLSQTAMATVLGVDQATISRWESGRTRIPASIEFALASLREKGTGMTASPRPRILVSDPVAEEGVVMLRAVGDVDVRTGLSPEELKAVIADYDALVVRSETKVTRTIIEAGTRLVAIGRAGVGVDNIDL